MIIFVDYEHPDGYKDGKGAAMQAARTWISYRLEDLSGMPCMLVRWNRITPELLDRLDVQAIFISGNGSSPECYEEADLAPIYGIIRDSGLPVFGFCGGLQCIALAFGATLAHIDVPDQPEQSNILTQWPDGNWAEFGYHPIELTGEHQVLEGLGEAPVFYHAHGLHVPELPVGFKVFARTGITPVQIAIDDDRRMIGTQFHPEYWTDDYPLGELLIANFMRWVGLIP